LKRFYRLATLWTPHRNGDCVICAQDQGSDLSRDWLAAAESVTAWQQPRTQTAYPASCLLFSYDPAPTSQRSLRHAVYPNFGHATPRRASCGEGDTRIAHDAVLWRRSGELKGKQPPPLSDNASGLPGDSDTDFSKTRFNRVDIGGRGRRWAQGCAHSPGVIGAERSPPKPYPGSSSPTDPVMVMPGGQVAGNIVTDELGIASFC